MVEIEGASPEQEALLLDIVSRVGTTHVRKLRIETRCLIDVDEPGEPGFEPTAEEIADATGPALVINHNERMEDGRDRWEAALLGATFCERAAVHRLPRVVLLEFDASGMAVGLGGPYPAQRRWADEEVTNLAERVRAAVMESGSTLRSLDVVQPFGPAVAVTTAVNEPHAFMRFRLTRLLQRLVPSFDGLAGWLVEVYDQQPEPVFHRSCITTRASGECATGGRPDLECCNPLTTRTRFIFPDPAPPCPVFGEPLVP